MYLIFLIFRSDEIKFAPFSNRVINYYFENKRPGGVGGWGRFFSFACMSYIFLCREEISKINVPGSSVYSHKALLKCLVDREIVLRMNLVAPRHYFVERLEHTTGASFANAANGQSTQRREQTLFVKSWG